MFDTAWFCESCSSLLNFHWFPLDWLCECGRQPPSIRKDVKYRARRTRIESAGGGGEGRRAKAGNGRTDKGSQRENDTETINRVFNQSLNYLKHHLGEQNEPPQPPACAGPAV